MPPPDREGMDDKDEKLLIESLKAANGLHGSIDTKKITQHLRHPNPEIRRWACYALDQWRDPAAIGPLLEASRDKEPNVRLEAARAISRTDSPQVVDRFMEMLQDSNPDVRAFAVRFLVWRSIPKAAPAIKRLLETEKDEGVRRAAGGSLW